MPVSGLALRQFRPFADAPATVVEHAARSMEIVHLKRREVLAGDKQFSGLGLVLQGRLQAIDYTMDGREVALITIEEGGMFGQVNLLAPKPVEFNWVAQVVSTLAVMPHDGAISLLEDKSMNLHVARDLARQVNDFLGWQKILSVHPVSTRICAWLMWHFAGTDSANFPTHAELAWRLNTTRESVTRTLQRLQAEQLLERSGEQWRLSNRQALGQLARGETRAGQ